MSPVLVPASAVKAFLSWSSWPGMFMYCLGGLVFLALLILCEFGRGMVRRL